MTFADKIGQKQLATALAKVLPNSGIDFDVLATDVVSGVELAALLRIERREEAMQEALRSVMDYYNHVVDELRIRVAALEESEARLTRQFARRVTAEVPA